MIMVALLFSLLTPLTLAAMPSAQHDLSVREATVQFLAVGKPSMLKIHGKADSANPLKGFVRVEDNVLNADATIALDTFDTGIGLRNRHMKEKYLQTDQFPTARLVLTPVSVQGGATSFEGNLTLRGQTKPVEGTLELKPGETLELKFEISIADFGIETPSFMGIKVTDTVEITTAVSLPQPVGAL